MRPNDNHRSHRLLRLLPWMGAVLLLSAGGSGTAFAGGQEAGYAQAGHGKHYRHHGSRHGHYSHDRHSYGHRSRGHGHYRDHSRHHGRHRYDHHGRYDRHYRYDSPRRHHRRHHYGVFEIPRKILRDLAYSYRSYYHSRVYHSGHRHHHDVYRFPVYNDHGGVNYYPYAYCQGSYYQRGRFGSHGPIF